MKYMRTNRTHTAIICLLLSIILMLQPISVFAEGEGDNSLTLKYEKNDKPLAGAHFSLYRVAEVVDGEYVLTGEFGGYDVNLNGLDTNKWRAAAETLEVYALRDKLIPMKQGVTSDGGQLVFGNLQDGLYLVSGDRLVIGDTVYTAEPTLIYLPGAVEGGTTEQNLIMKPKCSVETIPAGTFVERKVLKVWESDDKTKRPREVQVQLLKNGDVYETISLNEGNNWRYTWSGLDAKENWLVIEEEVPAGYTVSVLRDGITFAITNTGDVDNTGGSDGSGTSGGDSKPPQTDSKSPQTDSKLPQTGMLWWPVPLMAGAGLLLFMLGWYWYQNRSDADEE